MASWLKALTKVLDSVRTIMPANNATNAIPVRLTERKAKASLAARVRIDEAHTSAAKR